MRDYFLYMVFFLVFVGALTLGPEVGPHAIDAMNRWLDGQAACPPCTCSAPSP